MEQQVFDKYILRYAAGAWWLLDITQEGLMFQKPVKINEIGADIWKLLSEGKTKVQVAQSLADMYEAPMDMLTEDIDTFVQQLHQQGIQI